MPLPEEDLDALKAIKEESLPKREAPAGTGRG
jgi:hypothetical protein